MIASSVMTPRAFVVRFRNLHRWSVGSFVETGWRWPTETIKPLSAALSRKVVEVDRNSIELGALRLVTLHFDGEMEQRDPSAGDNFKGRLFYANPGDMIYSKIDVRNGAVGIIPEDLDRVCVSSEYPVYSVDPRIAEARYVKLVFRTDVFLRKINSMISGASGRKRVQPTDLETVKVPLPPLPVQRQIVAAWEGAQKAAAETTARIEQLERDIEAHCLADLGIENRQFARLPKCFAMPWRLAERWSVEFLTRKAIGLSEVETGKYDAKPLSLLVKGVSGSTPSKGASQFWGGSVPWVSPKDMKTDIIIDSVDHISEDAIHKRMAPLLPANSVLVVMRSGILQRTVPVALARRPVSINQDMRALIVKNKAHLLPSFLAVYLQCRRADLLKLVKWSTTVQSINAKELESFPIPLPPLPIQSQIVERFAKHREEIAKLKAEAKARAAAAKTDVEAMILGAKEI
jgi:type I restriction enzyme, S subunit